MPMLLTKNAYDLYLPSNFNFGEEKILNTPTKENIATVRRGFEEFFAHMIKTQSFNLQEFVNFMEPKFAAAGYRDKINRVGGGYILLLTEVCAGDFIVATGAIREVRRLYPDAYITLVVYSRTLVLAEACPYVDKIIVIPQEHSIYTLSEIYQANMAIARTLLEQRFDICFSFSIHSQLPFLMYMSGAKIRLIAIDHENLDEFSRSQGLKEYFMRLATHLFPYSTYGYHRADRFFSLLENLLHLPISNRKLEIWCTPEDVEVAKKYLSRATSSIYSLNMGGTYKENHYPPEKYARLLEMILREEPNATFVILGGGQGDLNSAKIIKTVSPKMYANNIIDLTNKITYKQSAAVLSFCKIYIGNDTGTTHLAVAMGRPVLEPICFPVDLTIKNTDCPARWYPYGVPSVVVQPAHALPECRNFKGHAYRGCAAKVPHCIAQIEPETLFKGFKLLKKHAAAGIKEPFYMS